MWARGSQGDSSVSSPDNNDTVAVLATTINTIPRSQLLGIHRMLSSVPGIRHAIASSGLFTTPISQKRKLRLREVKSLAHGHTAVSGTEIISQKVESSQRPNAPS